VFGRVRRSHSRELEARRSKIGKPRWIQWMPKQMHESQRQRGAVVSGSPGGAVGKEFDAVLRQGACVGSGSGGGKSASLPLAQSGDGGFSNAFWEVTTAETRERGAAASRDPTVRTHWYSSCDGRLGCGEKAEAFAAEFFPPIGNADIDWKAERSTACRTAPQPRGPGLAGLRSTSLSVPLAN
jgi:hypothetical protein